MTAKIKGAQQSAAEARRVEAHGQGCIWYTKCRNCKMILHGTIKDLLEHKCGQTG